MANAAYVIHIYEQIMCILNGQFVAIARYQQQLLQGTIIQIFKMKRTTVESFYLLFLRQNLNSFLAHGQCTTQQHANFTSIGALSAQAHQLRFSTSNQLNEHLLHLADPYLYAVFTSFHPDNYVLFSYRSNRFKPNQFCSSKLALFCGTNLLNNNIQRCVITILRRGIRRQ